MATEYHLLTCLGGGVDCTFSSGTPGQIRRVWNGMRVNHKFYFEDNGNTLPTGLSFNTPYYVKTIIDYHEFTFSATEGGSAINLTDTGSGTHIIVGWYWHDLPATDPGNGGNYRGRYGTSGSERVHAFMRNWADAVNSNKSIDIDLVLEIQGAWDDRYNAYFDYGLSGYKTITIHTKINEVRDPDSYHYGVSGAGYVWECRETYPNMVLIYQPYAIIDGVEVRYLSYSTYRACITVNDVKATVRNCITKNSRYGITFASSKLFEAYNNIAVGCGSGFKENISNGFWAFNMAIDCEQGFECASPSDGNDSTWIGNLGINCTTISFKKTTGAAIRRFQAFFNAGDANDNVTVTFSNSSGSLLCTMTGHGMVEDANIQFKSDGTLPTGLSENTPYFIQSIVDANSFLISTEINGSAIAYTDSGTGNHVAGLVYSTDGDWETVATTDFVDYSGGDYRPSAASSPQVDKIDLSQDSRLPLYDIALNVRPSYIDGSTDKADIGPFEHDHGNGLAPVQATVTIAAQVSLVGAEVRIYDNDGLDGDFGTEIDGVESHTSATYSYTDLLNNEVIIQIMQDGYKEYIQSFLFENTATTLNVTLKADLVA